VLSICAAAMRTRAGGGPEIIGKNICAVEVRTVKVGTVEGGTVEGGDGEFMAAAMGTGDWKSSPIISIAKANVAPKIADMPGDRIRTS